MKIMQLLLIFLVSFSFSLLAQDEQKKHGFIGAEACGMCHKTEKQGKQYDIWKGSKHAKAYEVLLTEEANKIAKDLGFETTAAKTPKCLKCHTAGSDVDATLLGKKFKMEDGVQCESCHGAGSDYKDMRVMKNREEAVKNGLVVHSDLEKFCVTCHNPESPTYIAIDIQENWNKIKHPTPKQ